MQNMPKVRWWQWPNVLALDAALVGAGWLLLVADALWVRPLATYAALVLGLCVWLVYTADRWLDVRKLELACIPTARHRFVKMQGRWLTWVWKALLLIAVFFAFNSLALPQLIGGLLVLLLALMHTWLTTKRYFRLPLKELVIGFVFAGSVFAFIWGLPLDWVKERARAPGLEALLLASSLFGLLCFANCALIAERERAIDQQLGRSSIAQRFPHKRILWAGLAVMAGLLGCVLLPPGIWGMNAALAISGGVLGLLGVMMEYFPPEAFRVYADTAMLTPWLVLLTG